MDNIQAVKLVNETFLKIKNAESVKDLQDIISNEIVLKNNRMNESIYPNFEINLSPKEIMNLKSDGILTEKGILANNLSSMELSPLEKLLYSILWKNGDLKKEMHIVEGVESSVNEGGLHDRQKGLVFFQFGKHLANKSEPIIDQHVIRSFAIFKNSLKDSVISNYRSMGSLTKTHSQIINDYKNWLVSQELTEKLRGTNSYTFFIDKILFSLGKSVKVTRNKQKKQHV